MSKWRGVLSNPPEINQHVYIKIEQREKWFEVYRTGEASRRYADIDDKSTARRHFTLASSVWKPMSLPGDVEGEIYEDE